MDAEWHDSALKIVGRWGLALLVVVALLLLSTVPFRIAHLGEVRPAFMLMAVYYWSILRTVPPLAVFAAGLVLDLLSAYPLGLSALILVIVQTLTSSQRKFLSGQSFLVIWAAFALVALVAGFAQWGVFSLFETSWMTVKPMLISAFLSAVLFPLAVLPLAALHKALAGSATVN
jgi:rod shape-determining protein MreD